MHTKLVLFITILMILKLSCLAQYPFEKYPGITYQEYNSWKTDTSPNNNGKVQSTRSIQNFFSNHDAMILQVTSFSTSRAGDSSFIRLYRNNKLIQKCFVRAPFTSLHLLEPIRIADINGDSLPDIKLVIPYLSCGLGLNTSVIYLFQNPEGSFTKISFFDQAGMNTIERDFDGDKNYEIVTTSLISYQNHSYFLYNLYDFLNGQLVNVNTKDDYPIMIQFLNRMNYEITKKISRERMNEFARNHPQEYDIQSTDVSHKWR